MVPKYKKVKVSYSKETTLVSATQSSKQTKMARLKSIHYLSGIPRSPTNVAYKKTAHQSSNYGDRTSDKAIDGLFDDFTHTDAGEVSWWRVDLMEKYSIGSVQVHNREECKC